MKIYKIKNPAGKISKGTFNRKLAFTLAKQLNAKHKTDTFKVIIWANDAIVHDHPLTQVDSRSYKITHFEVRTW
jgi:hypothetical protein